MLFCPREWQIGIIALFLKQIILRKMLGKNRYSTGEYPANTNKIIRALPVKNYSI